MSCTILLQVRSPHPPVNPLEGIVMRFARLLWNGRISIWILVIVLLGLLTGHAQAPNPPDYSLLFDKTDVMITARDGVKLHTEIYSPKNSTEPLPIVIERTPYGVHDDDKGYSRK